MSDIASSLAENKGRPAQLILIRHGESERNKAKRGSTYFADEYAREKIRGIPDHKISLTGEGIRQAKETGIHLQRMYGLPDYIYHSGYVRTEQTTEAIFYAFSWEQRKKINIRMNHFVRERDPGYTYDMTTEEAESRFPWMKEHWETFGGFFSRPEGGESLSDVTQRVYIFLNTLFRDRAGKKVWVVTHGGTLRSFRFLLERWTYDQALHWPEGQSPKNCGVTVYNFGSEEKRLVLQEYNTTYW